MPIAAISTILGFCGLVYEFVLAQSLSILFGHSVVQYSLTIGLFMAGMGLGSHLAEKFKDPRLSLWRTQLVLSLLAPLSGLSFWFLAASGYPLSARSGAYIAIISIGCLTGTELPLLLRLRNKTATGVVLSADYIGMLLACVLFPLWLLPQVGVFKTLFLTALLNSLIMISLHPRRISVTAPVTAALGFAILIEPSIREYLSKMLVGE